MIPTKVFPELNKFYPNHHILCIKQAWKPGFGWSANIHFNQPVLAQVRILRNQGFKNFSFLLRNDKTSIEFIIDVGLPELVHYKLLQTFIYGPNQAIMI
jgi:hypothetical protein